MYMNQVETKLSVVFGKVLPLLEKKKKCGSFTGNSEFPGKRQTIYLSINRTVTVFSSIHQL